jgi:hypothetical protein
MPSEQLKFNIMTQSIKDELALTEQEQRAIAKFLSIHLETLKEQSRIGRKEYDFSDGFGRENRWLIEGAIKFMAETIWE